MTVATIEPELNESDARSLTDQIAELVRRIERDLDALSDWIIEAYDGKAWQALGYETWSAYVDAELKTNRLKLDRAERQTVVLELTDAGMSTRAVGSALGVAKGTVDNDVANSGHLESAPVTGLDGKTYTKKPKPEPIIVDAEIVDDVPANVDPETGEIVDNIRLFEGKDAKHADRIKPHLAALARVEEVTDYEVYGVTYVLQKRRRLLAEPKTPGGRVEVIVLPQDSQEAWDAALEGTHAYSCSTCCGSARYRVGDLRVCSRHIGEALRAAAEASQSADTGNVVNLTDRRGA